MYIVRCAQERAASATPLTRGNEECKALARDNGTSRRANGWAGEKVARSGKSINQPPSLERNEQAWMEHVYRPMHAGEGNLAIPFIRWIKVKKGSILSRLLKKFASKAAADENTGGVASGLR